MFVDVCIVTNKHSYRKQVVHGRPKFKCQICLKQTRDREKIFLHGYETENQFKREVEMANKKK